MEAATGVKTPENLANLQKAEIRFRDVVDRDKIYEYVMGKIME